jgi:competence protein ComEA
MLGLDTACDHNPWSQASFNRVQTTVISMAFKTTFAALALSIAASTMALAQTAAPQAPTTNPLRPATPAAPAAPAAPAVAAPKAAAPAVAPVATPARPAANQSQLVNLNTAPAADLDNLPQIGAARSAAIIAKRPYKDWADFVSKNVVPSNAEAAIKDKVRFR